MPEHQPHHSAPIRPRFADGRVRFDVHVPKRLQLGIHRMLEAENFKVDVLFTEGLPVAFVESVGVDDYGQAASGVGVVRDFLRGEFRQRADDAQGLIFCELGPSPFHADFAVIAKEGMDGDISVDRAGGPGYDQIDFMYNKTSYESDSEALEFVKSIASPHLGAFYEVVLERNWARDSWNAIDEQIAGILREFYGDGIAAWMRRAFLGGRQSRRLSLEVLEMQSAMTRKTSYSRAALDRAHDYSRLSLFEEDCEQEIQVMESSVPPKVNEFVAFFDLSYSRTINLIMVLLSSLVGGIVGALITAFMSTGK